VVPVSIERSLQTVEKNQTEIRLTIFQGESRLVKNNIYLGELNIKVPKNDAGKETITVRYSYDMNGLLEVDVTVDSTGKTHNKTIINSPTALSEKEIIASRKKLEGLKFHPRDSEENRHLIARAERLYESSLENKREYIGNLLTEFDRVIETQHFEDIKKESDNLKEVLDQLEQDDIFV